ARAVTVLFHDGRVSASPRFDAPFDTPAEERLPPGLENVLAAQALFPLLAETEMAGEARDNPVARAARRRPQEAWEMLATRVRTIPAYAAMLTTAYPDIKAPGDIAIHHIANALSAFIAAEWQSYDSRYDLFLSGQAVLTAAELRGRALFFGAAGCSGCHTGALFSDQQFHALGLPTFGPGRTRAFDPIVRDRGRLNESDRLEDAYRFRTPMLRNVALTAPYGHNGAYPTLTGIVRHHLDPKAARAAWDPALADLPPIPKLAAVDFIAQADARETARQAARIDIAPVALSTDEVADIVAFLGALTGGDSTKGRLGRPDTVPSGLEVD
ncbi:MAG: cytochrome c peroxidase, partial [Pseudomonadota bacterium]